MSVKQRTLVIIGLWLALLLLVLLFAFSAGLRQSVERAEAQSMRQVLYSGSSLINSATERLRRQWLDWSVWDDTVDFIVSRNRQYVRSNLNLETFVIDPVNVLVFVDLKGRAVWGHGYDSRRRRLMPVPGPIARLIRPGSWLLRHRSHVDSHAGLLMVGNTVYGLISQPIVSSDRRPPIRGTLIAARRMDGPLLAELSGQCRAQLNIRRADFAPTPPTRAHSGRLPEIGSEWLCVEGPDRITA
jgi:sensor domain CHASE-containing protein